VVNEEFEVEIWDIDKATFELNQRSFVLDNFAVNAIYQDRVSVTETSSYLVVNVQQAGFEQVLWALHKTDIDNSSLSVHRLLVISGTNS